MTEQAATGRPVSMRFGLVGTGHWARVTHAPAIAATAGATLVGVWGRRPEMARALADTYGARVFADVEALFAEVDAVAFSVPPDVQAELATRAARAGCHLLLDKPIALSRAAGDTLAEAVVAADVRSLVGFTSHFQPDIRQWLADAGATGDWDGATAHRLGSAFYPNSPWDTPWRRRMGGLWDIGPHVVSMLLSVLGPVDRVSAERGRRDTVAMLLHHTGGATSMATVSSDAPPGVEVNDLVIWGSRGRSWMPAGVLPSHRAFSVAVSELISGQHGVVDPPCDVHFGRAVLEIIARLAERG